MADGAGMKVGKILEVEVGVVLMGMMKRVLAGEAAQQVDDSRM